MSLFTIHCTRNYNKIKLNKGGLFYYIRFIRVSIEEIVVLYAY